jgi:BASS family bile acid:Na+ symporter
VTLALRRCPLSVIVFLNFIVVPALTLGVAVVFEVSRDSAIAMILLGAAPFAPIVPVFVRLAKGALALAAALTAVFPLLSAVITPFVVRGALQFLGHSIAVRFEMWSSLALLVCTICLPLGAGIFLRHYLADVAGRLLRPLEICSEATGLTSLAFVTWTKFEAIIQLGWRAWLAMTLVSELSLIFGWQLGGRERGARQVGRHSKFSRDRDRVCRGRQRPSADRAGIVTRGLVALRSRS